MVQRKEGQLRYGKLLLSDGSVADYPTAFILVENRETHRSDQRGPSTWIIARPWLEEDSEEGILEPVVVPGAAEKVGVEEELAFEQVDLAGILDRMHKLPDSVTFAFTDEKKPNPYDIPTLRANIPPEVRDPVRAAAGTGSSPLPRPPPGLPTIQPLTPGGAGSAELQGAEGEGDIVDLLMSRMESGENPLAKTANGSNEEESGKGPRVALQRAAAVPPKLQRAAKRLVDVGVPEFRCDERIGVTRATRFLQSKDTFTGYVEAQKHLKMPQQREAMTEARALDLATAELGAGFLATEAAEVLLRRMLALILGCRAGQGSGAKMRFVESIEELPGEDIFCDVPEEVLVKVENKAKVSMKLEKLAYELENTKRS